MPTQPPHRLAPVDADPQRGAELPIDAYGLIGDCHGAALVGLDGSIDWCCLKRFDAEPLLARLLDRKRGGCFEIRPLDEAEVRRRYRGHSNVIETEFRTDDGVVRVVDFMAVWRHGDVDAQDFTALHPPGWVVRIVEGVEGRVPMRAWYAPVAGWSLDRPTLRQDGNRIAADGLPTLHADIPLQPHEEGAVGLFEVQAGQRVHFLLAPSEEHVSGIGDTADRLLDETTTFWTQWSGHADYSGPYGDAVLRSGLALKLMTYAPTGAIVAAPTTSLPEDLGGCRNWDYRYCWLRDTALTLFAFVKLGHASEAEQFTRFLVDVCEATLPRIQPMYGIAGETQIDERTLDHLEGYRGSRPVRVGNGAQAQRQVDVYGQVADLIWLYAELGGHLDDRMRDLMAKLADLAAAHWRDPDHGIWEPRLPPRRHVHSAILAWVALDRAIRLLETRDAWLRAREAIVAEVHQSGVHPDGYLRQAFDNAAVDAALLAAPLVGFPLDEAVLAGTVGRVRRDLAHGPLVHRYRNNDGLAGEEGAFLLCSFRLVDALLMLDHADEARELYEALLGRANDLGLFPEEMAPDGTFLGNFPQAFTHIGVIHSAIMLQLHADGGVEAVRGSYADRARRIATRAERFEAAWGAEEKG